MAEFCTCGSIVIAGHCTNKNCVNKAAGKAGEPKATTRKAASAEKKPAKTKKASKCIVYNLYDQKEENVN